MSVYYDNKSGRWFNTLADLKAFQRGEGNSSPLLVSEHKLSVTTTPKSSLAPYKQTKSVEVEKEPEVISEITEEEKDLDTEDNSKLKIQEGGIKVSLSPEEMKMKLKDAGVDGRSLKGKDAETLATMYVSHFSKRM